MVDLGEFVVISERQIEIRWQPNIIGHNLGELLDFRDSGDRFYLGDRDFLFFYRSSSLSVVLDDSNNKILLVGFDLIKNPFTVYEFEGLGPVVLIPVPHQLIKLNNKN
jgi:hypothetical protein